MNSDERERMAAHIRDQLVQAGMVPGSIRDDILHELIDFIYECRLSLTPQPMAISYRILLWKAEKK